jgi:hypothetical protein
MSRLPEKGPIYAATLYTSKLRHCKPIRGPREQSDELQSKNRQRLSRAGLVKL